MEMVVVLGLGMLIGFVIGLDTEMYRQGRADAVEASRLRAAIREQEDAPKQPRRCNNGPEHCDCYICAPTLHTERKERICP